MVLRVILICIAFIATSALATPITPLLYEFRRGSHVSYILGTFHWSGLVQDLPDFVFKRMQMATVIAVEADIDEINRLGTLSRTSLKKQLSHEAWQELSRFMRPWLSENQIDGLETWQAVKYYRALVGGRTISNVDFLDYELLAKAKELNKSISFLTTAQEHIRYYEVLFPLNTIEFLSRYTINPVFISEARELGLKEAELGAARFRQGDLSLTEPEPDMPEKERNLIITQRHDLWLPRILAISENSSAFIAMGSSHLNGSDGILTRLSKLGFAVKRVNPCQEQLVPSSPDPLIK